MLYYLYRYKQLILPLLMVILVFLTTVGYAFFSYTWKKKYRRKMRMPDEQEKLQLQQALKMLCLQEDAAIYFCSAVRQPHISGRIKPVLLLPEGSLQREDTTSWLPRTLLKFIPGMKPFRRCLSVTAGWLLVCLLLLGCGLFSLNQAGYSISYLIARGTDLVTDRILTGSGNAPLTKYYENAREVYGNGTAQTGSTEDIDESIIVMQPEAFSQEALDGIWQLEPVDYESYYDMLQQNIYEDREIEEDILEAEDPWQVNISDADAFLRNLDLLLVSWLDQYGTDWLWQNTQQGKRPGYSRSYIEIKDFRLLAGDATEFAAAVLFKINTGVYTIPTELAEEMEFGSVVRNTGQDTVYCAWTVHGKMTGLHTQELVGIAQTKTVLEGYKKRYPQASFLEKIPEWDLQKEPICRAKISEGSLVVTYDDGAAWKTVPVSPEVLQERGDDFEQHGANWLEESSYYVSPEKTVFVYGGGSRSLTALISEDAGATWEKVTIAPAGLAARRIFMGYLPESDFLWVVTTGERVVQQENTVLFISEDGGSNFSDRGAFGFGDGTHSLTVGAGFSTPENGFLMIRSSESPEAWHMTDRSWSKVSLEGMPEEWYTMAYSPVFNRQQGVLYVGMEDYGEKSGVQCRFVTEDGGDSWQFDGLVMRQ